MTQKIFLLCLLAFANFACSPIAVKEDEQTISGVIDADDPYIQYVGRFDHLDPKNVRFDWPGVYICANFQGTSCSVILEDGKNEYEVIIDHKAPKILTTDTSTVYQVASELSYDDSHSILIQKRTETFVGTGEFGGFILDNGCQLVESDKRPDRKIEFIGNSITCGYGVEGDSATCHFSPQTENACISYAAMTSRELNADYSLIAFSGRGVVRNYGDSNKVSFEPMPGLYDRTCYADSLRWDFTSWVPQVVVINLGTNDFSTQPFPEKKVFQSAYKDLIHRVRSYYPGVTIFCVCGPMIEQPCWEFIKEVVATEQQGKREKDVFFVGIEKKRLADSDWGCDYHPNIFGMKKMTDLLVSAIKLRMRW